MRYALWKVHCHKIYVMVRPRDSELVKIRNWQINVYFCIIVNNVQHFIFGSVRVAGEFPSFGKTCFLDFPHTCLFMRVAVAGHCRFLFFNIQSDQETTSSDLFHHSAVSEANCVGQF